MFDVNPATVGAWKTAFAGKADEVLHEYILSYCKDPDLYALLLPIIQSTCLGKSRLVFEYSLKHFTIPVNLGDGTRSEYLHL